KTSIKIAALNIKGHGSLNVDHMANKWGDIKLLMLNKQIGILIVGEAHMNAERKEDIERKYGKHLKIFYSKLEATPNAAGVAIILNKNLTNTEGIQTYEIVPGHAILLEYFWHGTEKLSILAIYAPNANATVNANFWSRIHDFFLRHPRIRKPDFMLGDCNMVEEPLDRLPSHSDPHTVTEAFDELKCCLHLEDGWRNTFPSTLQYTFMQKRANQITTHSRIDRIYIKSGNLPYTFEWKIEHTGVATDHDMVSVRYTCEAAPKSGRGRWIIPQHLMYDKVIKEFIETEGKKLETNMNQLDGTEWDPTFNHQTLWSEFKDKFISLARKRAKIVIPKLVKEINDLEAKIELISNDQLLTEEERSLSTAVLKEALQKLEERRNKTTRLTSGVNYRIKGETISRYWSNINKDSKRKDLIQRLQIPGLPTQNSNSTTAPEINPVYETNSQRMADMMKNHHDELQTDQVPPDETERSRLTEEILDKITVSITESHARCLNRSLTEADIKEALKLSANFKAPGLDGISYEIWKILQARSENAKAHQLWAFDIVAILTKVYNSIESHGMAEGTRFSESWMCPLYKKNDRTRMENYRPISLLNTDYKIFTKALTIKL
ncbi:hypothetical protein F5878DRAFT_511456, partial [Lentinula raphanica]